MNQLGHSLKPLDHDTFLFQSFGGNVGAGTPYQSLDLNRREPLEQQPIHEQMGGLQTYRKGAPQQPQPLSTANQEVVASNIVPTKLAPDLSYAKSAYKMAPNTQPPIHGLMEPSDKLLGNSFNRANPNSVWPMTAPKTIDAPSNQVMATAMSGANYACATSFVPSSQNTTWNNLMPGRTSAMASSTVPPQPLINPLTYTINHNQFDMLEQFGTVWNSDQFGKADMSYIHSRDNKHPDANESGQLAPQSFEQLQLSHNRSSQFGSCMSLASVSNGGPDLYNSEARLNN